jgi:hypothetical protein
MRSFAGIRFNGMPIKIQRYVHHRFPGDSRCITKFIASSVSENGIDMHDAKQESGIR